MDRLHAMAVFVAVAKAGSFAQAAREKRLSPPAVTRAIAALEHHVGVQLLNRTTHSLSLTEAGQRYLETTRQILANIAESERVAAGDHGTPIGHLRLTASVMFSRLHVVPILSEFLAVHSEITATLVCLDRMVNIVEDGIDVAIRGGELDDTSMRALRCGNVQRILVAAPSYLSCHPPPRRPSDLHDHKIIFFTGLMRNRELRLVDRGKPATVRLSPNLEINDPGAALVAAEAGLGITQIFDYMVADNLADGSLVPVLAEFSPPPTPVQLVYASGRTLPAKSRAFIDFAAPLLRDRLGKFSDG
ncbi:MAG: LysR family transcriptional regulator [Hyphomicrobiaceae bacterium]